MLCTLNRFESGYSVFVVFVVILCSLVFIIPLNPHNKHFIAMQYIYQIPLTVFNICKAFLPTNKMWVPVVDLNDKSKLFQDQITILHWFIASLFLQVTPPVSLHLPRSRTICLSVYLSVYPSIPLA